MYGKFVLFVLKVALVCMTGMVIISAAKAESQLKKTTEWKYSTFFFPPAYPQGDLAYPTKPLLIKPNPSPHKNSASVSFADSDTVAKLTCGNKKLGLVSKICG
jgi:hypothetical protein